MLGYRNVGSQQERVNRPRPVCRVVDIERVDAHQSDARSRQELGGIAGEEGMSLEILIRSPMPIPARLHQRRLTPQVMSGKDIPIYGAACQRRHPEDNAFQM